MPGRCFKRAAPYDNAIEQLKRLEHFTNAFVATTVRSATHVNVAIQTIQGGLLNICGSESQGTQFEEELKRDLMKINIGIEKALRELALFSVDAQEKLSAGRALTQIGDAESMDLMKVTQALADNSTVKSAMEAYLSGLKKNLVVNNDKR